MRAISIAMLATLAACQKIDPPAFSSNGQPMNPCAVTDYGNGVLLFTGCDTGFPNGLSAYIRDHAGVEMVTFGAIQNTESGAAIHGYLVVVRTN